MAIDFPDMVGAGAIGNIFDWGGDDTKDDQLIRPDETGGFLDWFGLSDAGPTMQDPPGPSMVERVGQNFVRDSLRRYLDGDDLFGVDLLNATDKGGWFPVELTPAGKKWAAIAGAALVLFLLTRGR